MYETPALPATADEEPEPRLDPSPESVAPPTEPQAKPALPAGVTAEPGPSRRIIVVHAMKSTRDDHWYAALRRRLEPVAEVVIPAMPNPFEPDAAAWQSTLETAIGPVDAHTMIIGHSVGNAAALRYLSSLDGGWQLGAIVNVAGFTDPQPGNPATPPFTRGIDHPLVRLSTAQRVAFIGSDDPEVPRALTDRLAERLDSTVHVVDGAGHFRGAEDGFYEFPLVESLALKFAARS